MPRMRARRLALGAVASAALLGCGSPYELHCRDLLPVSEATFVQVRALVVDPGARSCSRCHNTRTPVRNLNFEGPGVAYDALTTRMRAVYEQVASGEMPKGGPAWSEQELSVLRSWYCQGAPYAP
jgi:uncharacterized membrane protein